MFTNSIYVFLSLLVQISFWNADSTTIPSYIQVCKRDQDTIDDCVRNSIEYLRPKLIVGIPELKVPAIEPFTIPEILVDQGNVIRFKAVGRDIKVYGASNFKLKALSVDLDALQIRGMVYFPRLQLEGKYEVDARLLIVPIHGKGDIQTNATKCNAEIILQAVLENKNGAEYLKFNTVTTDIDVQDYSMRLTNLFNGDEQLGEVANQIINQNKAEFLRASKPYLERTVSNLFKKITNRIAGGFSFDEILPIA